MVLLVAARGVAVTWTDWPRVSGLGRVGVDVDWLAALLIAENVASRSRMQRVSGRERGERVVVIVYWIRRRLDEYRCAWEAGGTPAPRLLLTAPEEGFAEAWIEFLLREGFEMTVGKGDVEAGAAVNVGFGAT